MRSMNEAHHNGHTATLFRNGNVLIAGGLTADDTTTATAAIYNPATGGWTSAAPMKTPRNHHTATLIENGRVLVTGGICQDFRATESPYTTHGTAELYDQDTDRWIPAGTMSTPRSMHTTTVLHDGRALVCGGEPSTEIYDPRTGVWSAAGAMATGRRGHSATLLDDGKVLVAGGYNGSEALHTAEIYDSATGAWSRAGSMATARGFHTSVGLHGAHGGLVLVIGGLNANFPLPDGFPGLASAEIYDVKTGAWRSAGTMSSPRFLHSATVLVDGTVLVAGGEHQDISVLRSMEIYHPNTNTWIAARDLITPRASHTATVLHNGQVLIAGGFFIGTALSTAELFTA